jgi:protocatechuate 3,4-dioxygenase beta subunit
MSYRGPQHEGIGSSAQPGLTGSRRNLGMKARRALLLFALIGSLAALSMILGIALLHRDRRGPHVTHVDINGNAVASGKVLTPDGQPLEGATVRSSKTFFERKTNAEGRFTWVKVTPGGDMLLAEHPDYARAVFGPFKLEADQELTGIEIRLQPGGFVAGTLRDDTGRPVEGADVWFGLTTRHDESGDRHEANAAEDLLTRWAWAESGAEGRYASPALLPGSYEVGASCEQHFDGTPQVVHVAVGKTKTGVDLILKTGETVTGRVLDWNGNPIPNATVSVSVSRRLRD